MMDITQTLAQVGNGNLMAISGGRVRKLHDNAISLPVAHGYSVMIELAPNDTYTVRRCWRTKFKGTMTDVYSENLGDVAYRASCFHDHEPFGEVEQW
jgi:hypothetical protein